MAAKAFIREMPNLSTNPFGGWDEWSHNLVMMRCEERLTLAVPRPKAVVKVTGLG